MVDPMPPQTQIGVKGRELRLKITKKKKRNDRVAPAGSLLFPLSFRSSEQISQSFQLKNFKSRACTLSQNRASPSLSFCKRRRTSGLSLSLSRSSTCSVRVSCLLVLVGVVKDRHKSEESNKKIEYTAPFLGR